MNNQFLSNYFSTLSSLIYQNKELIADINKVIKLFKHTKKQKGKILFLGNGGSAAIASHVSVDLSKNAGIRAINFNESDLITCLSNDHGYDNWMVSAVKMYFDQKKDIAVLISCSGESKNIVNVAKYLNKIKSKFITLTGKNKKNSLKRVNFKNINFWINSDSYNHIELAHLSILLSIIDSVIGKKSYSAKNKLKQFV